MSGMKAIVCCDSRCGIEFHVPATWMETKSNDHSYFSCPNGHRQHFPQESDEEKLRRRAERAEQNLAYEQDRAEGAERRESAQKGVVTKLRKRFSAGVCGCCNRHFTNLERHMKSKHPDFAIKERGKAA